MADKYDPKSLTVTFKGIKLDGYADGEFLSNASGTDGDLSLERMQAAQATLKRKLVDYGYRVADSDPAWFMDPVPRSYPYPDADAAHFARLAENARALAYLRMDPKINPRDRWGTLYHGEETAEQLAWWGAALRAFNVSHLPFVVELHLFEINRYEVAVRAQMFVNERDTGQLIPIALTKRLPDSHRVCNELPQVHQFLRGLVRELVLHEIDEQITVDGRRPFDPHRNDYR